MFKKSYAFIAAVATFAASSLSIPAQDVFSEWPAGKSPSEIGRRVSERFVKMPHLRTNVIIYPEVCAWYGALTFAKLSGDKNLSERLIKRFEPLLTPAEAKLVPAQAHVDYSMFGSLPLEISIQNKDARCLEMGKGFADRQFAHPDTNGLTPETRFWVDDMYMINILQVQAYRATGDAKYMDRAALESVAYLDKLQQKNGLFYHAPDVPFFWGRGNGWFAVGMAEILRSMPENHPKRARIMEGYRTMMAALLKHQGADGMWRQLIDKPESWPETSCTGMFTFAMITGVKNGWLDKTTYGNAARKGWLALTSYINENADVTSVCEGTNKKNDYQYYIDRGRKTGDCHGQAPVLWCASALLR